MNAECESMGCIEALVDLGYAGCEGREVDQPLGTGAYCAPTCRTGTTLSPANGEVACVNGQYVAKADLQARPVCVADGEIRRTVEVIASSLSLSTATEAGAA